MTAGEKNFVNTFLGLSCSIVDSILVGEGLDDNDEEEELYSKQSGE